MPDVQPFQVEIPESDLIDLQERIRQTRWADDFGNGAGQYGVERGWLREMTQYWAEQFDWRKQEEEINKFPQFRVEIDSVPIHFIHVRGKGPNPTPIVLTHGWPWTFWDWKDVIEPLADPARHGGDANNSFDVVVPSLPGHGYSTPLHTTGIDARRVAGLWSSLMRDVLGYERFATGGGDWGSIISAELGHCYPEQLIGCWLTLPWMPGLNPQEITEDDFAADEQWMPAQVAKAAPKIQSHWTTQMYEPQTLAYALVDSPVGTAAWLWSRRSEWSDCNGDVLSIYDRDFLCATASIYWLNRSIGSSFRLYWETWGNGGPPPPLRSDRRVIDVPTGYGVFPKEVFFIPRAIAEERTNLKHWSVQPRGGHFCPSEQPDLVVDDIRTFFGGLRTGRLSATGSATVN